MTGVVPSAPAYTELTSDDLEYSLPYSQNANSKLGDRPITICNKCNDCKEHRCSGEVEVKDGCADIVPRTEPRGVGTTEPTDPAESGGCPNGLQDNLLARAVKMSDRVTAGGDCVNTNSVVSLLTDSCNVCKQRASDHLSSTRSAPTAVFNPSLDLTSSYYRCQAYAPVTHDISQQQQQQPIYFRYVGVVGPNNVNGMPGCSSSRKTVGICRLCAELV